MSNPALLWIPAGIAVLLLLGVFVAMAVLIWKGSRAEIAALRARSCTFCGYDLSRSPHWPDLARHDPTPKCPECGRVITGIAGRTAPLPEGGAGGGRVGGKNEPDGAGLGALHTPTPRPHPAGSEEEPTP